MWYFAKKLCTRRDVWVGELLWWSGRSLAAHSCSLLNHPNSFHRGMFKLKTKCDADLLLYLLSHFECDGHTVHMLTFQGHLPPPLASTAKSSLFSHVHSSSLSLAARLHDVANRLIILTMAGLFPDRPHIHTCSFENLLLASLIFRHLSWRKGPFLNRVWTLCGT